MLIPQTDAAKLAGCTTRTVRRWVAAGHLESGPDGQVEQEDVLRLASRTRKTGRPRHGERVLWNEPCVDARWQRALAPNVKLPVLGRPLFALMEGSDKQTLARHCALAILAHVLKIIVQPAMSRRTKRRARRSAKLPLLPVPYRTSADVATAKDVTAQLLKLWFCCKHYPQLRGGTATWRINAKQVTVDASFARLMPLRAEAELDKLLARHSAREILALAARFVADSVRRVPPKDFWLVMTRAEQTELEVTTTAGGQLRNTKYFQRRIGRRQRREASARRGCTMAALLGCSNRVASYWRQRTETAYRKLRTELQRGNPHKHKEESPATEEDLSAFDMAIADSQRLTHYRHDAS